MSHNNLENLDASGVWMTISEVAEAKGVRKASISERVLRLEGQGLLTTRPGKGRTKLVNLAEFDRAIGQVTDLAREQGIATRRGSDGEGREPTSSASSTYTREQAKRMAYLAEMSRLDLQERQGKLVRADRYGAAVDVTAAEMVRIIDLLPQKADAIAVELHTDDVHAVRVMLRRLSRQLRTELADGFDKLLKGASEFDEPISDDESERVD